MAASLAIPVGARLIRDLEAIQGELSSLKQVEGGLILARIGAQDLMIPQIMGRKLGKLQGCRVEIARIGQQYGCRRLQ